MYAKKTEVKKNKRKNAEVKNPKNTRGFFFFAKILFVVFTGIILFGLGKNLNKINSKKEELEILQQEHNSKRIQYEALQKQSKATVDDEYIANIVKQMGYRKADEILFYLDSEE